MNNEEIEYVLDRTRKEYTQLKELCESLVYDKNRDKSEIIQEIEMFLKNACVCGEYQCHECPR